MGKLLFLEKYLPEELQACNRAPLYLTVVCPYITAWVFAQYTQGRIYKARDPWHLSIFTTKIGYFLLQILEKIK